MYIGVKGKKYGGMGDGTENIGVAPSPDSDWYIRHCNCSWSYMILYLSSILSLSSWQFRLRSERLIRVQGVSWEVAVLAPCSRLVTIACRMQLTHCCLLKESLACKVWACPLERSRKLTRKKFLARSLAAVKAPRMEPPSRTSPSGRSSKTSSGSGMGWR